MEKRIILGPLESVLANKIASARGITVPQLIDRLIQHEAALVLAFGNPPAEPMSLPEPQPGFTAEATGEHA
jgi:hypothetical protein